MLLTSIDGVQREIKELWEGKDGVNTETKEMWAGIDGINKQIFSSFSPDPILNNNEWATIGKASTLGVAESIWSVGDRKGVTLNGKLNDGLTFNDYTCYPYILGFNHNKEIEGDGTITFQIGYTSLNGGVNIAFVDSKYGNYMTSGSWFNMNNTSSNVGGWGSSRMRMVICPAFKNVMPSDLRNVLKSVTKYTDNTGGSSNIESYVTATTDEIFLLANFELFGIVGYANSAEKNYQAQYAFYSAGNSKVKYIYNDTSSTVCWWLRSVAVNDYSISSIFCNVSTVGGENLGFATASWGFAPAFVV